MPRVTDIITSIIPSGKSAENVNIDTAWTGTDGDLILAASVPATVEVGDTIIDSSGNTYLITGISGSNLTSQDFDTTTDPATGSATIQEAYQTITLWEADLDVTAPYVSSDNAIGELYDNGAFDETVNVSSGGTVGLSSITLTVPVSERHDGTAGTGARIVLSSGLGNTILVSNTSAVNPIDFEWFEITSTDVTSGGDPVCIEYNQDDDGTVSNMILHDLPTSTNAAREAWGIFVSGTRSEVNILNNIIYDIGQTGGTSALGGFGIQSVSINPVNILNNTIHNCAGTDDGLETLDDSDTTVRNNIVTDDGGSDYTISSPSNADYDFNLASDDSDSGANSIGADDGVSTSNLYVSTTSDSEDLHIQDTAADQFEAGTDLGITPTGVNFDIDNFDRNAGATTWSMGAHDGDNLRGAVGVDIGYLVAHNRKVRNTLLRM